MSTIDIVSTDIGRCKPATDIKIDPFTLVDSDTGRRSEVDAETDNKVIQSDIERLISLAASHINEAVQIIQSSPSKVHFTIRQLTNFDNGEFTTESLLSLLACTRSWNCDMSFRSSYEESRMLGSLFWAIIESLEDVPEWWHALCSYRPYYLNEQNAKLHLLAAMAVVGNNEEAWERQCSLNEDAIDLMRLTTQKKYMPKRFLRIDSSMYDFFPMIEKVIFALLELCSGNYPRNVGSAQLDMIASKVFNVSSREVTPAMREQVDYSLEGLSECGRVRLRKRTDLPDEMVEFELVGLPEWDCAGTEYDARRLFVYDASRIQKLQSEIALAEDKVANLSKAAFQRCSRAAASRTDLLKVARCKTEVEGSLLELKRACDEIPDDRPFRESVKTALKTVDIELDER